jgi:serine protease Do
MKRVALNFIIFLLASVITLPANSQDEKEKEKEKKKDVEQIIITRKGDDKEKIVIEVTGDKVTINGKPADELKDGDIKVRRNKIKTTEGLNVYAGPGQHEGNWNFNWDDDAFRFYGDMDENRAMLGVVTEKADQGAKVTDVTEESAAKKAGIKEGDIITKIDDTKIEDPDDLSSAVRKHKPGDKVTVTVLRDKKEQKLSAELGKWKGAGALAIAPRMPDMKLFEQTMPRAYTVPRTPYSYNWSGSSPRLGLSVQDTDEGKGVKVIEVDDEGNAAKAGIKENDIITHVNDKEVNSADEIAKIVRENKDKASMQVKIKRAGKIQTITVKMPRKLKTADL